VPTEFHISIDQIQSTPENLFPTRLYMEKMRETAKKIPSFGPPHEKCSYLTQNFEEEFANIYDSSQSVRCY
jgi:hypothetical protein